MPNQNYRKGADFERSVRNFLSERLTPGAMRSAGSHGPYDVAGHGLSFARLIQCKKPRKTSVADVSRLIAGTKTREITQYASNEIWICVNGSIYIYAEALPDIMDMLVMQMRVMFDCWPGDGHERGGVVCRSWVVPQKRLSPRTSRRKSGTGSHGT